MSAHVEKTAKDFSKFLTVDMDERLKPINKSIDDMLARLEEFQTMISFAKQERINATELVSSIQSSNESLNDLFQRIDSVEKLVQDVKSTLDNLEAVVEKAEEEVGVTESKTSKVANIFTPLFKKTSGKKQTGNSSQTFKTSDYFN
ncbi:Biogenesis of lysosome-related organelles complex 1 subunit 4-like Protein [Tribolium castaneum]|uniref:Biogenesis of lysosome-related organelles complex 1 subunit 4-like Protein n=1 Tax=Tribolium castaneum TaxID=7070 RepID=D6WF21_TRICA|nr:PREDICTED: biogenesis of lysosome-related organelles complex 1 subunit 4 [Tribolium castaneum]EEZ99861.2 Biogenesis of lysosome-related organelles complex 1 subunit 4-like Protein [Tribolium castaneum]|eukprot:XP_008191274.1 PREDICTED: biogenesis of lysosome-related organelles complex 1 subunit 4 [Tribolium castaneum]